MKLPSLIAAIGLCCVLISYAPAQKVRSSVGTIRQDPRRSGPNYPPPAAGTWQQMAHLPPAPIGCTLLLTDGTVIGQNPETRNWYKLTPDVNGSYLNGTWNQIASTQSGYAPLYFASAVLANGKVIVLGGEYNVSGGGVWTNKGAIYDPLTNVWTPVTPPPGWANIGDAQCTTMPDGKLLLAMPFDTRISLLDPATMVWTNKLSTGKVDRHDEEGWTLLPDGTIITVDALNAPGTEKYIPSQDRWINAGSTPQSLEDPSSQEIGPAILMYNGKVFAMGATGHNAIYTPGALPTDPGSWAAAPDFPNIGGQLDIADGPACLLTNGNVLCDTSPGIFNSPSNFFEFDGTNLLSAPNTPNNVNNSSFVGTMLMLPTGEVMFTDFSNDVRLYTSSGGPQQAWRPTITSCPTTIQQSLNFTLTGTQLNGLSQCTGYGDDSANYTNYPIVRIRNVATGHVRYARTHDHSTMAVATGSTPVSTQVSVPANVETGPSVLEVVANGIPSVGFNVNVVAPNVVLPTSYELFRGNLVAGDVTSLYYQDSNAMQIRPGFTVSTAEAPIQLRATGTAQVAVPTNVQISVTARASTTNIGQRIYLFDFTTNSYELIDSRAATMTNQTVTLTPTGNVARFVDPINKTVKAMVTGFQTGPIVTFPYRLDVDNLFWTVS